MCRLYVFSTVPNSAGNHTSIQDLVHGPNALVRQSCRDRQGECHGDGWGIGYYVAGTPHVERSAAPAFAEDRFAACAVGVTSPLVLAHVRAGSVGERSVVNTHPFQHGRWLFAHNGTVTAFDRVGPGLLAEAAPRFLAGRRGSTDSELVFCWLLSRMTKAGLDPEDACPDLEGLAKEVASAVRALARRCKEARATEPAGLNFVLTDGVRILANRWGRSLFWVERQERAGRRSVAIASEPTDADSWQEVPEGGLLTVEGGLQVGRRHLEG